MEEAVEIINPINYPDWNRLIINSPDCTFFHSANWAQVLSESYKYIPMYFMLLGNDGLKILIPFMEIRSILTGCKGVSLPFTDYCQPIVDKGVSIQDLLKQVMNCGRKRGWKTLEMRGGKSPLDGARPYSFFYRHSLDFSQNEEHVFSCFRDSTKRNIKKAISEGVDVRMCTSLESIKYFYNLNCMTRKEHGLPPQPYHFFEKVYKFIISRNLGFVALASYKNKIIAGSIFFHFGNNAIYKYGASDRDYQHLRGNNLVMWEAIKWYCKSNYKNFCFGRTEPENQGLRQFKNGWGAKEDIIHYYRYDLKNDTFEAEDKSLSTHNFYNKMFKKTPIFMLRIVGSLLYRHIG